MIDNPYQAPVHVTSDSEPSLPNSDANADLTTIRRAVLFLTLASSLAAAWFGFQFCGVIWLVVSGYFRDSGFASADIVGIILDRVVCRAILVCAYVFVALRLYSYAKCIRGFLGERESGKALLFAAQRRAWLAIVSLVVVFVIWNIVIVIIFGFLFRGWGDW